MMYDGNYGIEIRYYIMAVVLMCDRINNSSSSGKDMGVVCSPSGAITNLTSRKEQRNEEMGKNWTPSVVTTPKPCESPLHRARCV